MALSKSRGIEHIKPRILMSRVVSVLKSETHILEPLCLSCLSDSLRPRAFDSRDGPDGDILPSATWRVAVEGIGYLRCSFDKSRGTDMHDRS